MDILNEWIKYICKLAVGQISTLGDFMKTCYLRLQTHSYRGIEETDG